MVYYLVGIKGTAMSSLAKLLKCDGHTVKGVDVSESFFTEDGLENIETFDNCNLKPSYYYIIGNGYVNHNITNYIMKMGYYYKMYPVFIKDYYKDKKWICISGSHGKTTTTKLISHFLNDNISLIGDGTYKYGNGDYFIIEACEYRNTFLNYNPYISLVLNVDYDHPDFFKNEEDYKKSFIDFVYKSEISIVNGDELDIDLDKVIKFGVNKTNDVVFEYKNGVVYILNKPFYLPYFGKHFAYDFVGAYLVCKLLNIKDIEIQNKLNSFRLPKRRMVIDNLEKQVVVLDYAHHPTEIKVVYNALKEEYKEKRIIVVFEPHTISRLITFLEDFKESLSMFDECYLYDLFSSVREKNRYSLEKQLYENLGFNKYDEKVKLELLGLSDVIVCFLGAGVIDKECNAYKNDILFGKSC